MSKPDISVIIATYNRKDLLLKLIKRVRLQEKVKAEIIVADDGSKNPEIFEGLVDWYLWKKDEGNTKVEMLRAAIRVARCEKIVFLDDDAIPQSSLWLYSHYEGLDTSRVTKGAVYTFKVDEKTGEYLFQYPVEDGVNGKIWTAINMGFYKEDLIKLDAFDMIYNGNYAVEDTDLINTFLWHGYKIKFLDPNISQVHHIGKLYNMNEQGQILDKHKVNYEKFLKKWGDKLDLINNNMIFVDNYLFLVDPKTMEKLKGLKQ